MKIENGVLICLYVTPQGDTSPIKQLVVPKSLRDTILDCLHTGVAGGHLGQEKTLSKLKARFYCQVTIKIWSIGAAPVLIVHLVKRQYLTRRHHYQVL